MGSTGHLNVGDSYISFRSARASSVRSLNLQPTNPEPIRRSISFRGTVRTRSWTLKKHKCLASYVYNVVVLGSGAVGKSALVQHYVLGSFPDKHTQTLADVYEKNIHRETDQDDSLYCLKIFDTAGTISFPAMTRLTIRSGNGFLLVYALDDRSSFEQAKRLYKEIMEVKNVVSVPLLLVANKSDLPHEDRKVTTQEGMKLAKKWGVNFAEISAMSKSNIDEVFQILFDEFDTSVPLKKNLAKENGRKVKNAHGRHRQPSIKDKFHAQRKSCSLM